MYIRCEKVHSEQIQSWQCAVSCRIAKVKPEHSLASISSKVDASNSFRVI